MSRTFVSLVLLDLLKQPIGPVWIEASISGVHRRDAVSAMAQSRGAEGRDSSGQGSASQGRRPIFENDTPG